MLRSKILIIAALSGFMGTKVGAESVSLGGTDYEMQKVIDREIAPGVQYMRLRFDSYPLNVNMLKVDLSNPGNRVETTVANESAKGTELLVNAAKRLTAADALPWRPPTATSGWYRRRLPTARCSAASPAMPACATA